MPPGLAVDSIWHHTDMETGCGRDNGGVDDIVGVNVGPAILVIQFRDVQHGIVRGEGQASGSGETAHNDAAIAGFGIEAIHMAGG